MKLFSIPVFLLLYHSASSQIIEMNNKKLILSAKVKSTKCYIIKKSGDSTILTNTDYDRFGNMTKREIWYKDEKYQTIFYNYDDHHFLTQEKMIGMKGDTLWRNVSVCDSAGNSVKVTGYGKGDTLTFNRYLFYNTKGLLTREVTMLPNAKAKWGMSYEYDSAAHMIRSTVNGSRQPGTFNLENKYDSAGHLISSMQSSYYYASQQVYENDAQGRKIKQTSTFSYGKDERSSDENTFTYYPNGLFYEVGYYKKKKLTGVQRVYYTYY